jgi:hypothetical protein
MKSQARPHLCGICSDEAENMILIDNQHFSEQNIGKYCDIKALIKQDFPGDAFPRRLTSPPSFRPPAVIQTKANSVIPAWVVSLRKAALGRAGLLAGT